VVTDDVGPAGTATTSSTCVDPLVSSSVAAPAAAPDGFCLFSEHLLCDSQGVIDVGLLADDQPTWIPSRLDDKVKARTERRN